MSPKPIIHGPDHVPGGADPIPNWPTGAASTDFGPSSYDVPLFAFGGAANLYASTGVGWTTDSTASRGGYVTKATPAQNSEFVVLAPLHPKGAIFGIHYTRYLGSDFGILAIDIASLTYQSANRTSGDPAGKIQDVSDFTGSELANYDSNPNYLNLITDDCYNPTPIGESNFSGSITFIPGGDEGAVLSSLSAGTDPYGGFSISDGGPGWYAVRFKVKTKNASSSDYRFRVAALAVLRVADGDGF